ncbi:MAG: hypothetical protein HFJ28_04590 [Clostridia bacterium]|jgi:hypothetical protein|nr:hypothetical protein [Clostridia bacterium]
MEQKIKYQYTYFIYPYMIEEKDYTSYLYSLLKRKNIILRVFDRKKDIEIDTYFLPEIKERMFWTIDFTKQAWKDYETTDTKMKANLLSKKYCCFFEYSLEEDIPAKIGEEKGIFFDITKIEILCFSTGVCFLTLKTTLNEETSFSEVLNFNYKFRDIGSKAGHSKEYDNIKIQTNKFQNMETFEKFLKQIAGINMLAKQINLDTNRLITYSYTCLDQNNWNENTDIGMLEKEFEKYRHIWSAGEQIDDITTKQELVYQEKYIYYGFSVNSTVLLTSSSNIKNYTSLLFNYETEQLYHYLYHLHQKIYLKKLNYEFTKTKNFNKIRKKFLNFAKKDWIYEVTNDVKGSILESYYRKAQKLDETFLKLKKQYDLLYKDYEITKTKKHGKKIMIAISLLIIINLFGIWLTIK